MLRNLCRSVSYLKKPIRFPSQISMNNVKHIHCAVCLVSPRQTPKSNNPTSAAIASKYQVITEENSPIIENTEEEIPNERDKYPLLSDEFDGINLKRGTSGVFEIEDLIELLKRENAKDVFVATVPKHINYVEYICVVTAKGNRHLSALAEFVRRVYKKKCHKSDPIPRIEGKDSKEWMALDLGNIALHIFSAKTREIYDLETLWSVGGEFDEQVNKKSKLVDIFENYSAFLKDLKPLG